MPLHYVGGVWVALVCALVFMAFYAFRVAEEARQLADALAATELVLQREQHLSALDGLAAAAAHELGTPLATIALVAHELASELAAGRPARRGHPADPRAVASAAARSSPSSPRSPPRRRSISAACRCRISSRRSTAPHRDFGIAITIELDGEGPGAGRRRAIPACSTGSATSSTTPSTSPSRRCGIAAEWTHDTRAGRDRRRRAGLLARRDRPARRALRHDAAAPTRSSRPASTAGSASASSSPRRCSSAPARGSGSPTARRRKRARW